ncbi:MAG: hypothetical protein KC416_00535 [Myxococcales bacterium]|nr:hypothetical protein [Myxococcales bacterium]
MVVASAIACSGKDDRSTAPAAPGPARNVDPNPTAHAPAEPSGSPDAPAGNGPASDGSFPSLFFGESDRARRQALATQPLRSIEKGRGGRTLAFKIELADGTVGYYKPEQRFSGSHWYAELASYYLDRELGLGRVPPAIGRRLPWADLEKASRGDERQEEVDVGEDGMVRGAFVWWIPESLERLRTGDGWERWLRQNGRRLLISPYGRPAEWRDDRNRGRTPKRFGFEGKTPDKPSRPAELSDMILFDYLTTNVDRWGGDNTNVRTRGEGGPLLFFDNGAGFSPGDPRLPLTEARLHGIERFRKATVEAIRGLDLKRLEERMATDPLAPILIERQWDGLRIRRQHLLEYVKEIVAKYGDKAFFKEGAP